jgi:hypothetical protein
MLRFEAGVLFAFPKGQDSALEVGHLFSRLSLDSFQRAQMFGSTLLAKFN